MNSALITTKETRWRIVVAGYFVEVQDLVSHIDFLLKSRLRYSEIENVHVHDQAMDEEENEDVQATLHIKIVDGTELEEVKKLLQTETYKWIRIVDEGEVQSNDNGESMPIA